MAKYDVTLTVNTRFNKVDYRAGEVVEVDEALLSELQAHGVVVNVTEKVEKKARKTVAKKDEAAEEGA